MINDVANRYSADITAMLKHRSKYVLILCDKQAAKEKKKEEITNAKMKPNKDIERSSAKFIRQT